MYPWHVSVRPQKESIFAGNSEYLSVLKEEEINRLTTALECIRYGLTPRETLGYIGGAKK